MSDQSKQRGYRIVAVDGVASAGELQRDYEAVLRRQQGGAKPSTVEAAMYSLRERGAVALTEPDCQRRLSELSPKQVREVIERLIKLRPRYPKIDDEVIATVQELLK